MTDHGLDLAVIGNGRTAALVDPRARLVWWCYPRFDSDPIFCRLVAGSEEKGFSDVVLDAMVDFQSEYLRNTAVVSTVLTDEQGGAVRITDFAPRHRQFGRVFRPPQLIRIIEPVAGLPRITVRFRPTHHYGQPFAHHSAGSNHIRYLHEGIVIRLTSDAPLSYIEREAPFVLTRPLHLVFGLDEPFQGDLETTCREFCDRTIDYWLDWSRGLSISYDWQDEIIRAAITLKLSNFEETGGIIAAHTTSIPEAPGSGRNWDYRYCWLRDAYFTIQALNRLGATRTMEGYLRFIDRVVAARGDSEMPPLFSITGSDDLPERVEPALRGYRGMGPVRIGNAAHGQRQHDVYGAIVLAAAHSFFDERLLNLGDASQFAQLEVLGEHALAVYGMADAGPWEFRGFERVHTFSAAMSWAGLDRLARIAARLELDSRVTYWRSRAEKIRADFLERAFNPTLGAFASSLGGDALDSTALLLPELGLVPAKDPRFVATVGAIEQGLKDGDWLYRYTHHDDFGKPDTSFTVCAFWYVNALAMMGRREEARAHFERLLEQRTSLGLLSEDIDARTREWWGNFPQTYSLVGIINSAIRLSRPWEEDPS